MMKRRHILADDGFWTGLVYIWVMLVAGNCVFFHVPMLVLVLDTLLAES